MDDEPHSHSFLSLETEQEAESKLEESGKEMYRKWQRIGSIQPPCERIRWRRELGEAVWDVQEKYKESEKRESFTVSLETEMR